MESQDPPDAFDDMAGEEIFANEDLAAREVPQLVAILRGEDNERAAVFRREAKDFPDRDKEEHVRIAAAGSLYNYAQQQPAVVAEHAATLVKHLDASIEPVRQRTALAIMYASTAPEPFVKCANEVIGLLDDDNSVVRRTAAFALGEIATVAPDDAVPAVDALVDLVDDPETRADATEALARIGDERPAAITAAAQPVTHYFRTLSAADDIEADNWLFRTAALEVIASIALVAPETIDDVSDALRHAMQSSQVEVRVQAADTISVLLTERPETFGTLEPHLRTGLDAKESRVRRAAVLAYLWIAFNGPTAVNEPATIAERLQTIDETFDISPEDLEQAVQAFADATTEGH